MKKNILILFAFLSMCLSSCGIYSFTGASYGTAKTVSIDVFPNVAPLVMPTLSTVFTEALKDKFIQQTPLEMVQRDADLSFEGEIRGYAVNSIARTAEETSAQNRLTITIHVKFTNKTDDKWSFDKSFSEYADYPSSNSLSSVEGGLVEEIVKKLVEDVFNASVANW